MESAKNFEVEPANDRTLWRDTMNDGVIKFKNVVPAFAESTADELSKIEKQAGSKLEHNEANSVKDLKTDISLINMGRLYYYPKNKSVYKILEVKKNDGVYESIKMTIPESSDEITLDKTAEIDTLRDYVFINLKIYSGSVIEDIVNTKVKLQSKLEDELRGPVMGATGNGITMFRFFHNSEIIDKEDMLSKLKDVKDNMYLFATTGYSKAYKFKRFAKPYEWPYWGYYSTTIDAIAFTPNQNVVLCGFTLYGTDRDSFELKYKLYVDNNVVEEENGPMV